MPCATNKKIAICFGSGVYRRRYLHCPVCERRRRFVQHYGGLWYPDTVTCLGCGDAWSGGELLARPFRPRWRPDSIRAARKHWTQAVSPAAFKAIRDAELTAEREYQKTEQVGADALDGGGS